MITAAAWALALVGAVLMAWAGAAKAIHPAATTESLALAGLPDSPSVARLLGVGEVLLASTVVVTRHPFAAAALALAYLGFTAVAWRLLATGEGSCGCFGEVDAPLSRLHVVVNGAIAVAATAATLLPVTTPTAPAELVLLVAVVVLGAALLRMVLVLGPALADGIQRLEAS